MARTRIIGADGKERIVEHKFPTDQVSLHDANAQQRRIDRERRAQRADAANMAKAAIDAAFRPKHGERARVQKPLRGADA